ncbi:MAG: nucleotidyltransferase family protein [Myxococcota bacterium]|nr:nucleotidyltransferase family protein [Myxococcota bacterium]
MPHNPQHIVLFHYFRRFLEAAATIGIDVAPLKGAHLLTSVYPDGEDRGLLADVDFLVRPEDWTRTCDLLTDQGFVRRELKGRGATEREFYDTGFSLDIGANERILFEPHRYLIQPERHPIDYNTLWRRTTASSFDGAPCRRLATEDHLLYTVIHMITHSFIAPKRELRDLELLIKSSRADLDRAVFRAGEWECTRGAWLALSLLSETTPGAVPERCIVSLAPPAPIRSILRYLVPDNRGFRYADLGLRAQQAVLFPLLLDNPVTLLRFGRYYLGLRLRDLLSKTGSAKTL